MNKVGIHYEVPGKKNRPWVIFLHGLLGSSRNWLKVAEAFENDFSILLVDQRGHGESFRPNTGYAPSDFATDLAGLMEMLKIKKAHIVGHSMGGRNALVFTTLFPDKVETLVIEDIGPEVTYQNGMGLVDAIKTVPVPFETKRKAKEYLLNQFGDPKLGHFLYTHITDSVPVDTGIAVGATWDFPITMVEEIIKKGRSGDLWNEVKALRVSTLVVRGELSQELTRAEFEKMQSVNAHVKGVEIAGAGHWVHFDKPKEFITALRNFLVLNEDAL